MKICRNLTFLSRLRQISRLKVVVMYFPEKGCHLGTNRSDNET